MNQSLRFVIAIAIATTLHQSVRSQSLGINTTGSPAHNSAMLDVESTTKGMLIPRMNKTQKNAIATPATGLLIFQNAPDSTGFYYYNGSAWVWLSDALNGDTTAWKITGNNNITASRFLGTLNDSALNFRVNNQQSGRIDSINLNTGFGYGTLRNLTYTGGLNGKTNSAFGYRSMDSTTSGFYNNAFGYHSMLSNTTGWDNSAFGNEALKANKTGSQNTALGAGTLVKNTTAWYNTAVGEVALYENKTTDGNTALGSYALSSHITNPYNTAVGFEALRYDTAGYLNTAVGWRSMLQNRKGIENTGVGVGSLERDTSGNHNTAIGRYAGFGPYSGSYNSWMGFQSGYAADTAFLSTNIGSFSGYYNKIDYTTAIGAYSLTYNSQTATNNTQGAENTGLGYGAGYAINLGSMNTAVGFQSMNGGGSYVNGSRNVGVGDSTLFYSATGNDNVAMGYRALSSSVTSSQNVAVGSRALTNFTGAYPNTAIGYQSMDSTTTGTANTAVGSYSFSVNTTGINNVAIGNAAMYQSPSGNNNTAVGNEAGRLISANQNTVIGASALRNDSSGTNNVAIGYTAAYTADSASSVIAIGTEALFFNRDDSNVAIGYRAGRTIGLQPNNWRPKEATFLGTWAGDGSFVSSKNTAVGFRALAQRAPNGSATDYIGGGRNTAIGDSSMANTVGMSNVSIGAQSLTTAGVGVFNNVSIGDSAMGGARLVNDNVAIGYHSLKTAFWPSSSNTGNTATGAYSGTNLTSGYYNTINGYYALENATTAYANTAVGTSSFRSNITGLYNVGLGINSGYNVTSGYNTYVGSSAGEGTAGLSTGTQNTGIGNYSLFEIQSGSYNTAVGHDALKRDTSGSWNVAVGEYALSNNVASDFNTAVGYNSLLKHKRTGFTYNTGLGSFALEQDSSGFHNTGVGTSAFRFNKTGAVNTGVGINAGYYQKESNNTFIGGYSGFGERFPGSNYAADTGNANTGMGVYSMYRIANGSNNVALGYSAMYSDSSGNLNTAVGNGALYTNKGSHTNNAFGWNALYSYDANNINGWNNAFGDYAGYSLANGTNNVMMGSWAMIDHTSGTYNTAMGNYVMGAGTGGSFNTAMGHAALFNTSADGNTGIGTGAGSANTTGTYNTLLGYGSDVSSSGLTNATAIGYNAIVSASNSLVLGASGVNVGINETSPNARLHIVRNGASAGTYHASSSMIIEDNTSSYLQFSNPNANETGFLSGNASTTIRSALVFRADSSLALRAGGNTTRMIVDNNGYIGMGTTAPNPATQFHLYEPLLTDVNLRIASANTSWEPGIQLLKTGAGSDWQIRTTAGGSLVYARSTDDFATSTDYYQMGVGSFIPANDASNTLGASLNRWTTVYATVGAINTSDARDKENITNLNYGLKEVMKLRPVSFTWKENPQWGKKIGFVAQEVQPILNEVVQVGDVKGKTSTIDADQKKAKPDSDKLGIYYSDIIPVTVKAIQEQQQVIEKQQKTIDELLKTVNELKSKVEKMEKN
ncbi:MAG: tail fiber domain-containing protein [Chitinophagaceae bacterium]|nr:tail fiber domain-containing protein [Chitinophagaceae bacterium]